MKNTLASLRQHQAIILPRDRKLGIDAAFVILMGLTVVGGVIGHDMAASNTAQLLIYTTAWTIMALLAIGFVYIVAKSWTRWAVRMTLGIIAVAGIMIFLRWLALT